MPRQLALLILPLLALAAKNTEAVINTDFCVVGGHSAGTYAAVRLQAKNKSVALISSEPNLGYDAPTAVDPSTGFAVNYGLQTNVIYRDNEITRNYFRDLGVRVLSTGEWFTYTDKRYNYTVDSLQPKNGTSTEKVTISINREGIKKKGAVLDFSNGTRIDRDFPSFPFLGMILWDNMRKLFPHIDDGFSSLPNPVSRGLTGPTARFFNLHPEMAELAWVIGSCHGSGDLTGQPLLYTLQRCIPEFDETTANGYIYDPKRPGPYGPKSSREIYAAAEKKLGESVFFNTTVSKVMREEEGMLKVFVNTVDGSQKIIRTKHLVVGETPTLDLARRLVPDFENNPEVKSIFGSFIENHLYSAIVQNDRLQRTGEFFNLPSDPLRANFSKSPAIYEFSAQEPATNLRVYRVTSLTKLPISEVKRSILNTITKIKISLEGPGSSTNDTAKPSEVLEVNALEPYTLTVPGDVLEKGFYKRFEENVQGKGGIWWVHGSLSSHKSYGPWKYFEDRVLPEIVK
jgi:hypothetical protein